MKLYHWLVGSRTRLNYWSCTKFADWLRKILGVTNKPNFATSEGWRVWKQNNNQKIGYWVTEEGLNYLQDFVMFIPDVYRRIKFYILNRFVDKPHYLDTKLQKGYYHEFDTRVLYGLFESFVDFIEIEKAHLQFVTEWLIEQDQKRWVSTPLYFFGRGRKLKQHLPSREHGLKYLDWEISLGDESPVQSNSAKEQKELYMWWKDIRPNRPDPYEVSGWTDYCAKQRDLFSQKDEQQKQKSLEMINHINQLEQKYIDEDTEMLIRLIKIRRECWT